VLERTSYMQTVAQPLRVVAIAGSLRAASYNRALLRAA
jgi:chromate reductase, NAD(P)H dehydrogenase (quinone)